jgi:hypothetical protein
VNRSTHASGKRSVGTEPERVGTDVFDKRVGAHMSAVRRFNDTVEQLRDWRGRERLIRRVFGLPAKAPQAPIRPESGEREKIRRRRAAWHAEDRRADIAQAVARLPISVGSLKDRALGEIEIARGKRALASARTLRYTSIYVLPTRGCTDIDGYFDFGRRSSFGLSLAAAGAINNLALRQWEDGDPLDDDGLEGMLGGHHILIPGDVLTPELAAEALRRWYRSRFESKRHHWTHLTGSDPAIVLDLNWVDDDQGRGVLS